MIVKGYIRDNLDRLENLYYVDSAGLAGFLYSKLAILELGGWAEESMEDIVLRHAKRHLRKELKFNSFKKYHVDKNHGFHYEKNFFVMLIKLIGIVNVERIERKIDLLRFDQMKSALSTLKYSRNSLAHTHTKGITVTIDTPSITKKSFVRILEGFKEFDNILRTLSF